MESSVDALKELLGEDDKYKRAKYSYKKAEITKYTTICSATLNIGREGDG